MKIKLGQKMGEMVSGPSKSKEVYYPTIRITKNKVPLKVDDDFTATISGTVKSETRSADGNYECVLEVQDITFGKGSKSEPKDGGTAFDDAMRTAKKGTGKTAEDDSGDYQEET